MPVSVAIARRRFEFWPGVWLYDASLAVVVILRRMHCGTQR